MHDVILGHLQKLVGSGRTMLHISSVLRLPDYALIAFMSAVPDAQYIRDEETKIP